MRTERAVLEHCRLLPAPWFLAAGRRGVQTGLHAKAVLVTLDVRTVTVLFVLVNLVLGIRAMR